MHLQHRMRTGYARSGRASRWTESPAPRQHRPDSLPSRRAPCNYKIECAQIMHDLIVPHNQGAALPIAALALGSAI